LHGGYASLLRLARLQRELRAGHTAERAEVACVKAGRYGGKSKHSCNSHSHVSVNLTGAAIHPWRNGGFRRRGLGDEKLELAQSMLD
jgi:hypothetical protein